MNVWWMVCVVLIGSVSPGWAVAVDQVCESDYCVQVAKNYGTINLEGRQLQIGINNGTVNVVGNEEDRVAIENYAVKVANLEHQINRYINTLQKKEERILGDAEIRQNAAEYTDSLLKQINQLDRRIALLDEQHELTRRIKLAKDRYDVPQIKVLLKEKQTLDDQQAAETAFELANFQELDLEYFDAYENFKKAVYLDGYNATYLNELGELSLILNNYQEAYSNFDRALELVLKKYGKSHPNFAALQNNLGLALISLGKIRESIIFLENALASDLSYFGESHARVAVRRNNLGMAWASLGENYKAMGYYEKALSSDLKTFGKNHPEVAIRYSNLAGAWLAENDYIRALKNYSKALESSANSLGDEHPQVAMNKYHVGVIAFELGSHQIAVNLLQQAYSTLVKVLGTDHKSTIIVEKALNEKIFNRKH